MNGIQWNVMQYITTSETLSPVDLNKSSGSTCVRGPTIGNSLSAFIVHSFEAYLLLNNIILVSAEWAF